PCGGVPGRVRIRRFPRRWWGPRCSSSSYLLRGGRVHAQSLGSVTRSGHDVLVSGAAAQISFETVPHLLVARVGVLGEQIDGRHDHPGRTEAALQGVLLTERLLDRMQAAVLREPFDGGDGVSV